MPLIKNVRDDLVVAFPLANIFCDDKGEYLSLNERMKGLQELQRFIYWQAHNPHQSANPGRSDIKKSFKGYLTLEASADLFLRFMTVPACPTQDNLAYITTDVQNFLYSHFKKSILPKLLLQETLEDLSLIDRELKQWTNKKVQGYAKKLEGQSQIDWQIFRAEVDVSLETLSRLYKEILRPLHTQFIDFRTGHLQFTQNYFDRCLFLARLEAWVKDVPSTRFNPKAPDELITEFNQTLIELDYSYNEIDLRQHFSLLNQLERTTLTYGQYQQIVTTLIALKPKYDAYRTGEDRLDPDQLYSSYMDAWPKPALTPFMPSSTLDTPAQTQWKALRDEERKKQDMEAKGQELKRKGEEKFMGKAVMNSPPSAPR